MIKQTDNFGGSLGEFFNKSLRNDGFFVNK